MKRTKYTFEVGTLRWHDEPVTIDGWACGPFVIHRPINNTRANSGWYITHRLTGYAVGGFEYKRRTDAALFVEWLMAAPMDWTFADAEIQNRMQAAFPAGAIQRAISAARAGEVPEPEYQAKGETP